jgi:hypothetical protein
MENGLAMILPVSQQIRSSRHKRHLRAPVSIDPEYLPTLRPLGETIRTASSGFDDWYSLSRVHYLPIPHDPHQLSYQELSLYHGITFRNSLDSEDGSCSAASRIPWTRRGRNGHSDWPGCPQACKALRNHPEVLEGSQAPLFWCFLSRS